MNRISGYNKTTTEIGIPPQTEVWNFYYGPTGIDKATRIENGVQNLTIDYSTDTNGRILSADYNKTGGSTVRIVPVYDNFGNIIAWKLDYGDMAKAVLINPNNGAIDTRYDPNDIDDPFSYRARDGFMGIGPLWANNDDGTVYMQGHIVIPNPWGNVSTNGTTTTTTDDTTDKDGGDDEGNCGMVIPEECKKILDAEADNYKNEPGDNFNCNEAHWDYDFYMCMMKYEKNEYDKSHYAKQARYALH